jgi:dTDP-4-amino-4,6-dideoxygalactose transaminase
MKIAMVDLKTQYAKIEQDVLDGIKEVLSSGAYIGGPFVAEFEDKMKDYLEVKHAIACANGTDALMVALMAMGIEAGDEVITSPFTFVATAEVIALLGAVPVYVDIDEKTYNIDASKIEKAVTEKTKAIIPVHIWGQSADMDPIMRVAKKHKLTVIEDNAQAVGSIYGDKMCGSIGDMATISFYPAKNLGAYGDAGMIVTGNDELAEKIRMICNHGSKERYVHELIGVNSRLDAIQAKILCSKLDLLDEENDRRREIAEIYSKKLKHAKITVPHYAKYGTPNIHQYGILVTKRDALRDFLAKKGVPTAVHYPIALHLQEAFLTEEGQKKGDLPIAESVADRVVNLPMHPYLTEEEINFICDTILAFVNK